MLDFSTRLDALEDTILSTEGCTLLVGDFNAKRLNAAYLPRLRRETDPENGREIYTNASAPRMRSKHRLCNFSIEITGVHELRVLRGFSAGDHQYIVFEVANAISRCAPAR